MVNPKETFPVTSFKSTSDPIEALFDYPGNRPVESYFTDGETVELLPDTYQEFYDSADELLRAKGLVGMDERIPLLSYGANAAPHLLEAKMKKFTTDANVQRDLQTVPHCKAIVPDAIAGWHGRPGQNGSTFAELVVTPETKGAELHAHIAYMTTEQLAIISISEGVTYSLAEVEVLAGDDLKPVKVLAYIALDSTIRIQDGSPVAVGKIPHSGKSMQSANAPEVVAHMLEESGYPIDDPREFAKEALGMALSEKKARQLVIGDSLDEIGTRVGYEYPAAEGDLVGRADFSSIPRVGAEHSGIHTVPEQELHRIRPTEELITNKIDQLRLKYPNMSDEELRKKSIELIDPARMLSRRAHDELKTRLNGQT